MNIAIPQDYISETGQRLRTYKRISSAASEEELQNIYSEIHDRYGRMPEEVENLFAYARLRRLADEIRVKSIDKTRDGFAIKFDEKAKVSPDALIEFVSKNEGAKFSENGILRVVCGMDELVDKVREALMLVRG
jgi:transcription-repair coupling factor (superfamily II helicase)